MQAKLLYGETETIRYTPSGNVARNTVQISGTIAGVAMEDIAADEEGALTIEGVFEVDKIAEHVFTAGDTVYWNATADPSGGSAETGACTNNVEDKVLGLCAKTNGNEDDTKVEVRLDQSIVPSS